MPLATRRLALQGPATRRLTDQQVGRIHAASLEILERTGVVLYQQEALDLLAAAGVKASEGNRVRIPARLVERALATAPRSITLYNRRGEPVMPLEGYSTFFGPGSDCPYVLDPRSGERRLGLLGDIEDAVRVCDALPNIDFLMSFCIANDVEQATYDRYQMRAMLAHSVKPILFVTTEFSGTLDAVAMAEAVAGGADTLRDRPLAALYINVTSPLRHNEEALQKLLYMADKGLPATYTPVVLRGANGPVTAAGAIALANAGELAGLVIAQLRREGTPVILTGGVNDMMDMRSMVDVYSAPENRVALLEVAHSYGVPIFGLTGCSDSKLIDEQAAAEAALSLILEAMGGAQMAHDVGYLEGGKCNSIEQIVICDELIHYVKRYLAPIEVSEETLALDLIDEIGPSGDFLGADHTRQHYREDWYPKLFDRRPYEAWAAAGGKSLRQRAHEKALHLLESHRPEPLPGDILARLDEIVAQARATAGTPEA
jgi:trimethylamine--corrinoid protein Co-methyltransferase